MAKNIKSSVFIAIFLIAFVHNSYAANYNWKFFVPGKGEKSIGEEPLEVPVGNWVCAIGKIYSIGPYGGEIRGLECSVGNDGLKASVTASCEPKKKGGKPVVSSGVLSLEQKDGDPNVILGSNAKNLTVMLKCY